ncbi:Fc.00g060590.m01.CDS01 [Cosmosporella sp. VM-42]
MTAATMSQTPAIPPRPAKGQDKDEAAVSVPKIPPRPITKRFDRSISPNPDRFAPSPLHEGIPPKSPRAIRFSPSNAYHEHSDDPIDRSSSVPMPSVGEEGVEYSAVTTELKEDRQKSPPSPEHQTATVAEDLKLHAPKPSLPAVSAKQRVQTVTRTDSDKAAAFGIGRPSTSERPASRDTLKKKPSTTFSATSEGDRDFGEEGIPEIGQRVPMNPHLGDVQAPSPAPGSEESKRHHHRKHSSRGGPPGSYGLRGHGVASEDKLDKAYYEKHPELLEREHYTPIHDRQNDFAMSKDDLNKLVRETTSRGSGVGTTSEYHATPTEEVGFKASEEYASRISSPLPADQKRALSFKSEITGPDGERTIHVDEPEHPEYRSYGDEAVEDDEEHYEAPILAPDEVSKDSGRRSQRPAVHPPPERRGSAAEMEDPPSRPVSRPTSRPTSMYHSNTSQDFEPTPLDDVKEYEPLFPDEESKTKAEKPSDENKARHHFPSKDIWEDAPGSVHYTAEVSTPDVEDEHKRKSSGSKDRPKTPAHNWAQQQEELAEREVKGHAESYIPRVEQKENPTWHETHGYLKEKRPGVGNRFPSKDIWEDVPESSLHETTVLASPEEKSKPELPARPAKKSSESPERPAVPERPKPKQTPSDEGKVRPPVSDKPKPQIPPRPAKASSGDSKDGEFSKPKPPVPSRPVGGKIAALQAGFMSDLNKRLQLGPQAPKKEEPKPQEDLTEETEKAPLADARKGRARGPQRRAPARSPAAPTETVKPSIPALSFSIPQTSWAIDPDQGGIAVLGEKEETPVEEKTETAEVPEEPSEPVEQIEEPEVPAEESNEAPAEEEAPKDENIDAPEEEEAPVKEEKTLVANTAGESVLEATVEKKENRVEPVDVEDTPKA